MGDSKLIILTMNGHDTHKQFEVKHVIYKHLNNDNLEIVTMCSPSKTMHKCQPLNVVIFSGVNHAWQSVCDNYLKISYPLN